MSDAPVVALSLFEFGIGIASGVLAAIAWQYRHESIGRPIIVMALATSGYAIATATRSFLTDPLWWHLVNNVRYPLGAILAASALVVVADLTDRERLQGPAVGAGLGAFVLTDFAVAMTDPLHGLTIPSQTIVDGVVVGTAGPLFWAHTVLSLSIVFVAVGLLVAALPRSTGIYRRQLAVVATAFAIGMGGFAWQSVAPIHPALDLAAVGMLGWTGLVLWGVLTADFLDIVPIGRHRIVESLDDPMVTIDSEQRVVDCNPAARQLAGVDAEWEGLPVASFFSAQPALADALESAESGPISVANDGRERYFSLVRSPIYRADSSRVGCAIVIRDVTASVHRQRELERARDRYRTLFEHSPLVLWEEDIAAPMRRAREIADRTDDFEAYLAENPDEHRELFEAVDIIDVNQQAVEAYGADSKAQLMGNLDQLVTDDTLAMNREMLSQFLDGDRRFRDETTYRTLDGQRRHELFDVFVPEPETEDEFRILIAGTDITEQKQREQELTYQTALFEALAESIDAGVLVTSADREILWHNRQFRELWGIPESVLEHGDDEQAVEYVLDAVADSEAFRKMTDELHEPPYEDEQTTVRLADGRWFERHTGPIVGDDGTRYGLLTLTRDITDRQQYERQIEAQNQRLERLAQVISHDLRTPLSTAQKHHTLLELELDDPSEPVAASLADLEATLDRLRQFTDHLPQLARESTAADSLEACSLTAVAEDAWAVTETGPLELTIDGDRTIQADPSRLQQLFENLFANVRSHATETPAGEREATRVHVEIDASGIVVADDGPGIGPDQDDNIFDYGMSTAESSGAGLAIVRTIVEAHGWSIAVDESAFGGAAFRIDTTGGPSDADGEEAAPQRES